MQYCNKCKVSITGINKRCPLCQGDLSGDEDKNTAAFPSIAQENKKQKLLLKFLILSTVIIVIICAAINISVSNRGFWPLYVIAGFISVWLIAGVLIKTHKNPARAVFCFNCTALALAFLWDIMTGFIGWSVIFVLPLFCTFATALVALFIPVFKIKAEDYLSYLLCGIFSGLIPLFLILFKPEETIWPSALSTTVNLTALSALVIFKGSDVYEELCRKFHI